MGDAEWPGLGFNPAKGDLHTVESLAYDVQSVGDELDSLRDLLRSIGKTDGVWEGEAAQNFSTKLGELPKYLKQGTESMGDCAKALKTWQTKLTDFQSRAKGLEADAVEARAKVKQTGEDNDRVNAKINTVIKNKTELTEAEAKQLGDESDAAVAAANAAVDALNKLIDEAEKLQASWKDRAGEAERAILKASENHPPDLHWWDQALDSLSSGWRDFKDWLVENADLLSTISSALAAAAIACQFIPVVGQVAGAVLGAGSVICAAGAMAGHWMGNARGNGTPAWKIGLDALGIIPGLGAAKGFTAGAKGLRAAGAGAGMMKMMTNPISTKIGVKVIGMFGKTVAPEAFTLGSKIAATGAGAVKLLTGGDSGGAENSASSAPAARTMPGVSTQPATGTMPTGGVRTMPYPATGDPFHAALAA
jgi:uncharacterized protein YukE